MERPSRRALLLPGAVFLAFAAVFLWQGRATMTSWPERSRLASVESLVERATFRIDGSSLAVSTKDKVRIRGHYYSDKPPLLQVLSAPAYWVLHQLGRSLDTSACPGPQCAYRPLTFVMVGLPSALLLGLFAGFARKQLGAAATALAWTACLGAATVLWPYSLVFNNHVPAAITLLLAFALVPPAGQDPGSRWPLLAGAFAGLAAGFDLLAALPALALGVLVAVRSRPAALWFGFGMLVVTSVSVVADLMVCGNPLPPYFLPNGYRYPGSPFAAGLQPPKDLLVRVVRGTIGAQGVFSHNPIVLVGVAGILELLRTRKHPLRGHAIAAGVGMLAFAAYVFLRTKADGGQAYGNRYFVSIVPLACAFGLWAGGRPRSRLVLGAISLAAAVGFISAARGARDPWKAVAPPLYLDVAASNHELRLCNGLAETCWPADP